MSVVRTVRLRVPAGNAKPGPAIGQALGPLGINMMDFCKAFNDSTTKVGEPRASLPLDHHHDPHRHHGTARSL